MQSFVETATPPRGDYLPQAEPQRQDVHWMLLPSLACPAQCAYCFGPNHGPIMRAEVLESTLDWIASQSPAEGPVSITFHGGEPLLAGIDWYRRALPLLKERFNGRLRLNAQSNLWLLDEAFCDLLAEYDVSLGTSLDGPEAINDAQRGAGYFARTLRGIRLARQRGLPVGAICTFTSRSAPAWKDVFDFFLHEGIPFAVHGAVKALSNTPTANDLSLTAEEYGELLERLFDHYLENVRNMRISTFDQMARGVSAGECGLCTFTDCLGRYLAVGPEGGIYPCNRYAHHAGWRMGSVREQPSLADLRGSAPWQKLKARQEAIRAECGDCPHFAYCKGGCPYNAPESTGRDRYCPSYKHIFNHITNRALAEVFSDENLNAVIEKGSGKNGLMQKGPLLQIMRGDTHPSQVTAKALEIAAAAALGSSSGPEEAAEMLAKAGIIRQPAAALDGLRRLEQRLHPPSPPLLNAYLHVTYACNLACDHCYAEGSSARSSESMPVQDARRLILLLAQAGYRKIIITGGEPLAHPQAADLLAALAGLRGQVRPARIILRSNLAGALSAADLSAIGAAADQIVASLDGDAVAHNRRRGAGTHAQTVANLRALAALLPGDRLAVSAALSAEERRGEAGASVRALAAELGIRARFKPLLPLGRAARTIRMPAFESSPDEDAAEAAENEVLHCHPAASCGLGMNLYIGPNGECFPCYALSGSPHALGSLLGKDAAAVLMRARAYTRYTVDSNHGCRTCGLRYLCGGFCRAWNSASDPDTSPQDCSALYRRASDHLVQALIVLGITPEDAQTAGLPVR